VEADIDAQSAGEDDDGKKKKKNKQKMSCFPGEAVAQVMGRGEVRMSELLSGDRVLAKSGTYEPVLGLLHGIRLQPTEFLTVRHSRGELRASANHIVFANDVDMLVASLQVGDDLHSGDGKSMVLSVLRSVGSHGMFAPLTPSGTIVVDNVHASDYAGSSETLSSPHGTAHAIAFSARVLCALQRVLEGSHQEKHQHAQVEELRPYLQAWFAPLSALQSWLVV